MRKVLPSGRGTRRRSWVDRPALPPSSPLSPGPHTKPVTGASISGREPEMQHLAIRDEIVLAFEPEFARLPRPRLAMKSDIVDISDGLGANKALFEIRVNHPRRLRRLGSLRDGPRACLLGAGREKSYEPHKPIARANDTIEPRLREAHRFEKLLLFIFGQNRDLALNLGRDYHGGRSLAGRAVLDGF